jgi:hypothetical protein
MRGVTFNVWQKDYNNTITGSSLWQYPEFKGYHSNVYWAVMETTEGQITVVSEDERLFLRLYTPPAPANPSNTLVAYPKGDISFLDGIPPVGDKFTTAAQHGPEGQKNTASGDYSRTLYFFFDNGTTEMKGSLQQTPQRFSLGQNYPNPFNPSTNILYSLKRSGKVRLFVYDLLGREVAVLVNGIQCAGEHTANFSGDHLTSGVYFYTLQTEGFVETKKMTLLK